MNDFNEENNLQTNKYKNLIRKMFIDDVITFKRDFMESLKNITRFDVKEFSWIFLTSTIMRWIAVITMFVDHFGFIAYPNIEQLRIIGRISFPIFAFLSVIGINYSKNPLKYCLRFLMMGVLIQIVSIIAFYSGINTSIKPFYFNIMFVLFLGTFSAYLHKKNIIIGVLFTLAIGIFLVATEFNISNQLNENYLFNLDYHSYGYLTIMFFHYAFIIGKYYNSKVMFKSFGILFYLFLNSLFWYLEIVSSIQIYALVDIPLFVLYSFKKPTKFWMTNYFFLVSYPLSFVIPSFI